MKMVRSCNRNGEKVEMEEKLKLPIVSEEVYRRKRIYDLAMAIHDFVNAGFFERENAITIREWCDELSRRLKDFQ